MFNYEFTSKSFHIPGYLKCTLPEEVKKEVQKTIKKIDEGKINTTDRRNRLAGHLQKETSFPITKKFNYLVTSLCAEYDAIFNMKKPHFSYHGNFVHEFNRKGYKFSYTLRDSWINYGKKYDFNPPHVHTGAYSFVLWVKIPYTFQDEEKIYPEPNGGCKSGMFEFFFPSTTISIKSEIVDTKEWDLVLFPASLHHTVYPFYTSDEERISISGNLFYEPVKLKKK